MTIPGRPTKPRPPHKETPCLTTLPLFLPEASQ